MIYIEAVEDFDERQLIKENIDKHFIFLAGSITNARDWQSDAVSMLKDVENNLCNQVEFIVFNPRRKNFDTSDKSQEVKQIEWEFKAMELCECIMFWFSHETLAPITLFEYGKWINSKKKLFVGVDPNYARRRDVVIQTLLSRPFQRINYSLENIIKEIDSEFRYERDIWVVE